MITTEFLFRFLHLFAGVIWIGMLYYFNFVQGEWFKEVDATTKSNAIQKLVPRALAWFRYGALFTFLSGFGILALRGHLGGMELLKSSWGIFILTGATLGTVMFLNVWLVIWPNQRIVIQSATQAATGGSALPNAALAAARAGLASRTNTLFSIPMLFCMGAASHFGIPLSGTTNFGLIALVIGLIIAMLELNALKGKLGPLTSIKGVIHCGLLLTVVLYAIIRILA